MRFSTRVCLRQTRLRTAVPASMPVRIKVEAHGINNDARFNVEFEEVKVLTSPNIAYLQLLLPSMAVRIKEKYFYKEVSYE